MAVPPHFAPARCQYHAIQLEPMTLSLTLYAGELEQIEIALVRHQVGRNILARHSQHYILQWDSTGGGISAAGGAEGEVAYHSTTATVTD